MILVTCKRAADDDREYSVYVGGLQSLIRPKAGSVGKPVKLSK